MDGAGANDHHQSFVFATQDRFNGVATVVDKIGAIKRQREHLLEFSRRNNWGDIKHIQIVGLNHEIVSKKQVAMQYRQAGVAI
jgi:hypothetical protein